MGAVLGPLNSGGGAVATAFAPTDLSGLQLWLKADSIVGKNDGDAIGTGDWSDSSGNGNNPAQGAAGNKPLYKTAIVNGLPVVRFDGSNDFLTVTRNAGLEPTTLTMIAVVRATAAPANSTYAVSKKHTAGAFASYALQKGTTAPTGFRGLARVATSGNVTTGAVADSAVWDGSGHIAVMNSNAIGAGFECATAINGVTATGNLQYDTNDLIIGSYDGTQLWMAFDLAELLIYNTALKLEDLARINKYLIDKYTL